MEAHLVADTNLFFEFKALEELQWKELGYDEIVILLTKPVLDEIDKHKKGSGRTRARALEIWGRVRGMLTASTSEVEIQSASPKVMLRLISNVKPNPDLKEELDYTKTDEKLVGIVSILKSQTTNVAVFLFTDDAGPASTAAGLGVPFLMINKEWRRPASETTEEKKIKELEKDLSVYRAQEPSIAIECVTDQMLLNSTRKIAAPLTNEEIEATLTALRAKFPLIEDFSPPPHSVQTKTSGEVTKTEYSCPPLDDINNYRDTLYPEWISQCRTILKSLHQGRSEVAPPLLLRWSLTNNGTRPASQVRVEFEVKGQLELQRISISGNRGKDEKVANSQEQKPELSTSRFPSAPFAPRFLEHITITAPPAGSNVIHKSDFNYLATGSLLAEHKKFSDLVKGILIPSINPSFGYLDQIGMATDTTKLLKQQLSILKAPAFDAMLRPSPIEMVSIAQTRPWDIPMPHIRMHQDPESFYYDWPSNRKVKKGALTCELWRHQADAESFEFEVIFATEGNVRGLVECTVHAENLTNPVQAKVVVERKVEHLNLLDLAMTMVANCE